jgi:hypothetical protein
MLKLPKQTKSYQGILWHLPLHPRTDDLLAQNPAFPTILDILRKKSGPRFYHFSNLQTTFREISVKHLLRKAYDHF